MFRLPRPLVLAGRLRPQLEHPPVGLVRPASSSCAGSRGGGAATRQWQGRDSWGSRGSGRGSAAGVAGAATQQQGGWGGHAGVPEREQEAAHGEGSGVSARREAGAGEENRKFYLSLAGFSYGASQKQ